MAALEGGIAAFVLRTIDAVRSQKTLQCLCPATATKREASCPHCRLCREEQHQPSQAPGSLLTPAALPHSPNLNSVQLTLRVLALGATLPLSYWLVQISFPLLNHRVNPLLCSFFKNLLKLNINLPCDPAISFLVTYRRAMKTYPHKNLYRTFIVAIDITAKKCKWSKHLWTGVLAKQNVAHLYNGILLGNN